MQRNFQDHLHRRANQSSRRSRKRQDLGHIMRSTHHLEIYPGRRSGPLELTYLCVQSLNIWVQSQWPLAIGGAIAGIAGWVAFMIYATNQEKLSSSVFRSVVRGLKSDPQLRESLGEAIRPQPEWYLNGDPYVKGHVSCFSSDLHLVHRSSCSVQRETYTDLPF